MLPDMDGWEFLSRIKQVPALRRIPVVIISIVADRNKGFALGAAAVMQKPISRQELYESLVELGLFPLSQGQTLKVLVVDDDPKAVELIAVRILGRQHRAARVRRPRGDRDRAAGAAGLDRARSDDAGGERLRRGGGAQRRIPTRLAFRSWWSPPSRSPPRTAPELNGYVTAIMEKAEFDRDRFTAEVRRAMSGRQAVA